MQPLFEYIDEALNQQTGIGAFNWGDLANGVAGSNLPHVVIDRLVQLLPGYGYTPTTGHVHNLEYKLSHGGYCLVVGVRPRATGEGTRIPSVKIFIRQDDKQKLSIVEKYLNIEGDGKSTFKTLSVNDDKFVWNACDYKDLPKDGDLTDSIEFAELLIKKIIMRAKRYTK